MKEKKSLQKLRSTTTFIKYHAHYHEDFRRSPPLTLTPITILKSTVSSVETIWDPKSAERKCT